MTTNKSKLNKQNNIVVVGQGAMGLLWYHHLSKASNCSNTNITLLASNQYEIKNANYHFTAYLQARAASYPLSYSQAADIAAADVILLCLKSYHIADAVKQLVSQIKPECSLILAHNGMGTFDTVASLLPSEQNILAMLTTHGCLRSAPLTITHTGLGQSDIGMLAGKLSAAKQLQLRNLLNDALPEVSFHESIINKQWLKLAINCVINPITAVNNIDNGKVNDPQFTVQINALLTEIVAVAQAENIELSFNDLLEMVAKVAQATAQNCSSMRSDVLAARPTEVDYINGYIHRLGQKNNIATPENTQVWQQVKALTYHAKI